MKGHFTRRIKGQAFDTNASTTMSVCDERGSESIDSPRIACFATGSVSPLHHRQLDLRYGNVDAVSDGLSLDSHNPDQRLQIILATAGRLDGSVLNNRNEPMANVKVALIPNIGYRNREDLYRNATTDATGKFKIQGIAAGDYRVIAWEDIADGAWQDQDVLRESEARGKPVHINEGEQSSVEVVAIPGGGR